MPERNPKPIDLDHSPINPEIRLGNTLLNAGRPILHQEEHNKAVNHLIRELYSADIDIAAADQAMVRALKRYDRRVAGAVKSYSASVVGMELSAIDQTRLLRALSCGCADYSKETRARSDRRSSER